MVSEIVEANYKSLSINKFRVPFLLDNNSPFWVKTCQNAVHSLYLMLWPKFMSIQTGPV